MKVKIKKGRWFYKDMVGKEIEVSRTTQLCRGERCHLAVGFEKPYYVHPEDIEEIKANNERVQRAETQQKKNH